MHHLIAIILFKEHFLQSTALNKHLLSKGTSQQAPAVLVFNISFTQEVFTLKCVKQL